MCRVQLTAGRIFFPSKAPFWVHVHVDAGRARERALEENTAAHNHQIHFTQKRKKTETLSELHVFPWQNIQVAKISKHWMHMSICTVTQTLKWLHVAAGWQPALRKVLKLWRNISKLPYFHIQYQILAMQFLCHDHGITFCSGFGTYSRSKL